MLLKHKRVILFEILQALYLAMYLTTISVYAILDLDNKIKCVNKIKSCKTIFMQI